MVTVKKLKLQKYKNVKVKKKGCKVANGIKMTKSISS